MNVGIMGAGLSGLSCAITLEQNGISPTVFESREIIGDRFICGELLLNIMSKPINNSLSYLYENHTIDLNPIGEVKDLVVYSKNEKARLSGSLGVMNIRGRHQNSFESQLYKQVKSEAVFNSKRSYEDLKRDFSHVVLATGDAQYAIDLNNYRRDFTVTLKGVTVKGDFNPNTNFAWFNYDFAPKGYAYLIPFSKDEANIVLAFPDHAKNNEKDTDKLWEMYYAQVRHDLKQDFDITDGFQVRKYIIGICDKAKVDNTYFTGNCFGAILPFLGFGQFNAILTGIYAAHDILGISDYDEVTKKLMDKYENSLKLRNTIEALDQSQVDFIVKIIGTFPINNFANYSFGDSSSINILKFLSKLIKS